MLKTETKCACFVHFHSTVAVWRPFEIAEVTSGPMLNPMLSASRSEFTVRRWYATTRTLFKDQLDQSNYLANVTWSYLMKIPSLEMRSDRV